MSVTDPVPPPPDDPEANAQAAAEAGQSTDVQSGTESESVLALRSQLEAEQQRVQELTTQIQQAEQSGGGDTDLRDLLHQLVEAQSAQRSEVQQLRTELARTRATALPATTTRALSPQELMAQRMAEVEAHDYYCPACGRTYDYPRECTGTGASPHPAVEVVKTDELRNPPESNDRDGIREYQSRHTEMRYVDPEANRQLLV